jgi:hypothetical protein
LENLFIEGTDSSPTISFDVDKRLFAIEGESYPENSFDFYKPVVEWLSSYIESQQGRELVFDFRLLYFNSSTSKIFLDLFTLLESSAGKFESIKVNWYYEADDDNMFEYGEEFMEEFPNLQFSLIEEDEDGE